jgi:5-methylcytosine-specific restriction endonuclease McrA
MRALVAALKQQKYAVTARLRKPRGTTPAPAERKCVSSTAEAEAEPQSDPESELPQSEAKSEHPRRRGRHVPAAVRRAVFERDEGRCTYTDTSGRRCAESHRLELHHLQAFARGGEHTETNLALRCRAHNALAAEQDFGRELIERAREASEHEPWAVVGDERRGERGCCTALDAHWVVRRDTELGFMLRVARDAAGELLWPTPDERIAELERELEKAVTIASDPALESALHRPK